MLDFTPGLLRAVRESIEANASAGGGARSGPRLGGSRGMKTVVYGNCRAN